MTPTRPIIVFFAFANDRADRARYLRNLPEEQRRVREALETAVEAGLCKIVERANATVDEVLDVFQDPDYRDRIALFHFGGHAGDAELLLESQAGEATVAHAGGLARFLGEQRGLELVFLNGCSSRGQVQGLLDAGVPAVIATSQAIDDAVATEFSARFYRALASGAPVRTAYNEAQAAVQTRRGELTREAYRSFVPDVVAEDRWPWDFYVAPGAEERLARWSLPLAARDPLFGLPPLPDLDLPASPFKHLSWFGRADAPVFFGRGREIRDLYEAVTRPDAAPIGLLFGATGVGKSSLLAAGLAPRLEATHEVVYLRRDGALGLAGTLKQAFGEQGDWRAREEATGRPLVVILDQAEEAWTRPLAGGKEADDLAAALKSVFAVREKRPRGRLILGFRKEWLAEMLRLVDSHGLPRFRVEITHLDHDAVVEAVAGPARSERLRHHYRLEVEPELPDLIADDLLDDSGAAIAPALQILLTKMWTLASQESPDAPRFTVELYRRLKRDGILLDDFLGEQLDSLRTWRPDLVDSGLVLDLLGHHTTALGTAQTRGRAEVLERYGNRPEIEELLRQCQDRYLLSTSDDSTRLAHDTLAPLVRRRFEVSDLPGQRALRILQQRVLEWDGGKIGPPLDAVDLQTVEHGSQGMRIWGPDEARLVMKSRAEWERRGRRERALRSTAAAAAVVILAAAGVAGWQGLRAEKEARTAERVTQYLSNMFQELDPYKTASAKNTVPDILDRGSRRIETDLADEPEAQDKLRETIAVVWLSMGRYRQAEDLFRQVVAFRRRERGEEHPETLLALSRLANTYAVQGRLQEGEELQRRVLARRREILGAEHPDTLASMASLANVVHSAGRPKEAEELNRQALAITRRILGEEHPDTLLLLGNLANVCFEQDRLDEAEALYLQVLALRRRIQGEEHPDTQAVMNNLAVLYRQRGLFKKSEDLLRQAFEINRRALGEEHPATLLAMANLAAAYVMQERIAEAEDLQRQVLAVQRKVLGEDHPETLKSINNLAAMARAQGRPGEGEDLLRKALALVRDKLGPQHPETLRIMNHLAGMYQEDGRLKEAEEMYRHTAASFPPALGPEHPETLWSMTNLAAVAQKQGHLEEAETLYSQLVTVYRRTLGEKHITTLSTMKNLADVYRAQGRLQEADNLQSRVLALFQQLPEEKSQP